MRRLLVMALFIFLLVASFLTSTYCDEYDDLLRDYNSNLAKFLFYTRKRSCIRRNGSCDDRPNDCCFSSSCRCNLWGTNCRCQRVGLFQKWGK